MSLTLLNVGRTHGAASFFNIHREFTKYWGTNGVGAHRFSIISAVAGSAFVPLPQFGLTVVLLCDCIVAFARGFHNYTRKKQTNKKKKVVCLPPVHGNSEIVVS